MNRGLRSIFSLFALVTTAAAASPASSSPDGARSHTREEFEFRANAPAERVFALLGAHAERAWAPDWNPAFLWPSPAGDREGMVFLLAHGERTGVWINTAFDRDAGRVQYVYVVPEVVATLITLQVAAEGGSTRVRVRYERTSLSPAADAVVHGQARHDREAGPEWEKQINRCLASGAGARAD